MQINDLTPSACRWILLSCCLTPPFFHSACAQNVNGETTAQTELTVKQGFVEGKVFDGGDHEPMIGVTVAIEVTTHAVQRISTVISPCLSRRNATSYCHLSAIKKR